MSDTLMPPADLDPRILGVRLQEARKARGFTQQYAAETLGMSRPTYIAIEKGERAVQPHELIRLAEIYGRSVHELLRQRPPVRDFVTHFRAAATVAHEGSPDLDRATALLQQLTDDYLELEQLYRAPLPLNHPAVYDVSGLEPTEAAEQIAAAERNRLGLGESPVPNLRDLLETDVGMRIFQIALPARVSGLFIYTEEMGACIALQRQHPPGRRLWSLCHEYAHFLVHRYEAEVTVLRSESRGSRKERLADSFAKAFLMPALGLRRRFHDLLRTAGQVTPAALITLADLYGVSFEALLLRLEGLRLLPEGTWLLLKREKFPVKEAQQLLGVGSGSDEPMLPRRFMNLAARAFEDALLSEGELVRILRTDRQRARRIVDELIYQVEVTDEGEPVQLQLDLGVSLAGSKGAN